MKLGDELVGRVPFRNKVLDAAVQFLIGIGVANFQQILNCISVNNLIEREKRTVLNIRCNGLASFNII